MQGTITISGNRDHGLHIEASLECDKKLDKICIKDIIGKLLYDNEKKEDKE